MIKYMYWNMISVQLAATGVYSQCSTSARRGETTGWTYLLDIAIMFLLQF